MFWCERPFQIELPAGLPMQLVHLSPPGTGLSGSCDTGALSEAERCISVKTHTHSPQGRFVPKFIRMKTHTYSCSSAATGPEICSPCAR